MTNNEIELEELVDVTRKEIEDERLDNAEEESSDETK
jgi:hypothetical protein